MVWGSTKFEKFGSSIAVSSDGNVMVVGSMGYGATVFRFTPPGGRPDQASCPIGSGNANSGGTPCLRSLPLGWAEVARLKEEQCNPLCNSADSAGCTEQFGMTVSISGDGMRIAVGGGPDNGGTRKHRRGIKAQRPVRTPARPTKRKRVLQVNPLKFPCA